MDTAKVYGIGNVLMDILLNVTDTDLEQLKLDKGIMKLVFGEERGRIIDFARKHEKRYICGGSAPNTVITLASLGIPSVLSGKIGSDEFGDRYDEQLRERGVCSHLTRGDGHTGTSIILITPDSERTMNTSLEINQTYSRSDIREEAIQQADFLYFTGYMWDTESQKNALLRAIAIAKEAGTRIVFDAADPFAVKRSAGSFVKLIDDHFDIALANAEEARLLFGHPDCRTNASRMADICDIALVKDGARGSLVCHGLDVHEIPVRPVPTVDTTGAGDIYAAGFLYGLCRDYPLPDAGLFASYLASQIVRQVGAQFSDAILQEVLRDIELDTWRSF